MPEIAGKILQCKQEISNPENLYAVSVMNGDTYIVSHGYTLADCSGAFLPAVQVVTSLCLAKKVKVTRGLVWPDPRLHMGIISCVLQEIMSLHEL